MQKVQNIHQHNLPKSFSITEEPDENEMTDRADQIAALSEARKCEVPLRINIRIEEPHFSNKQLSAT